jgi:hypothetical protein
VEELMKKATWQAVSFLCLLVAIWGLAGDQVDAAGPWFVAPTGDDTNDCLAPATTCVTIRGALTKSAFAPGDAVRVAIGTYIGDGTEVVLLDRDAFLSGGWDPTFAMQIGRSTLDGENSRRGITVESGVSAVAERFVVEDGLAFGKGGAGAFEVP